MIIFLFIFILLHFLISLFADKIIPYQGFFAYPELLKNYDLPKFIYSLANFDGVYYLKIAKDGYQQFEQAFFPLFPLLIRWLTLVTKNYLLSGLVIVYLSFFTAFIFLKKLLQKNLKNYNYQSVIFFLLVFPTSFFFISVYTESLFFLFLILFFYFFDQKKYFLSAVFGFFASLTRINGVLLIIPFLTKFIIDLKNKKNRRDLLFYSLLPIIGMVIYMTYLYLSTGDFLAFLKAQPAFGANRSVSPIFLPQVYFRYLKILITAKVNYQHFVALMEILIFTFALLVLFFDLQKIAKRGGGAIFLGINLFSLANLILPTLTGTFSSIPRYSLFSLSQFLFLGGIKNKVLKGTLLSVFSLLHFIFFIFYIQGYFIS